MPEPRDHDERPPLLGSWTRVYGVVLAWLAVVILAVVVFSRWAY
jgi:hypothetical protein